MNHSATELTFNDPFREIEERKKKEKTFLE